MSSKTINRILMLLLIVLIAIYYIYSTNQNKELEKQLSETKTELSSKKDAMLKQQADNTTADDKIRKEITKTANKVVNNLYMQNYKKRNEILSEYTNSKAKSYLKEYKFIFDDVEKAQAEAKLREEYILNMGGVEEEDRDIESNSKESINKNTETGISVEVNQNETYINKIGKNHYMAVSVFKTQSDTGEKLVDTNYIMKAEYKKVDDHFIIEDIKTITPISTEKINEFYE